jgi:hypothetical protein
MQPDLASVVSLLQQDVDATLGGAHRQLILDIAADVEELQVGNREEKVVNDVQQHFHDTDVDPTWPRCPRHGQHPLWYRDGSWWCVQDGIAVARLGDLGAVL